MATINFPASVPATGSKFTWVCTYGKHAGESLTLTVGNRLVFIKNSMGQEWGVSPDVLTLNADETVSYTTKSGKVLASPVLAYGVQGRTDKGGVYSVRVCEATPAPSAPAPVAPAPVAPAPVAPAQVAPAPFDIDRASQAIVALVNSAASQEALDQHSRTWGLAVGVRRKLLAAATEKATSTPAPAAEKAAKTPTRTSATVKANATVAPAPVAPASPPAPVAPAPAPAGEGVVITTFAAPATEAGGRCRGVKKDGTPCGAPALSGKDRCRHHLNSPAAPETPLAASTAPASNPALATAAQTAHPLSAVNDADLLAEVARRFHVGVADLNAAIALIAGK
jgi:LysM repeat protein